MRSCKCVPATSPVSTRSMNSTNSLPSFVASRIACHTRPQQRDVDSSRPSSCGDANSAGLVDGSCRPAQFPSPDDADLYDLPSRQDYKSSAIPLTGGIRKDVTDLHFLTRRRVAGADEGGARDCRIESR